MRSPARLVSVVLDETTLAEPHPLIAEERAAAIRDLAAGDGLFRPAGHERGAFRLKLSIVDGRLAFDITDRFDAPVARHLLSLTPLSRLIKDYFLICESYRAAIPVAPASRIEALDMGRRGLHDEAAEVLRQRLAGKIDMDLETARRLFTLVCALRWKG